MLTAIGRMPERDALRFHVRERVARALRNQLPFILVGVSAHR